MKKTSLQEQTSDPRWQRKRLEILERDKWTCKQCGDTETTLTVHHKSYRMVDGKFVDYWDYQNSELITLCDPCHKQEEMFLSGWKNILYFEARNFCEDANAIEKMVNIIGSMKKDNGRRVTADEILDMFWSSDHCKNRLKGAKK